MIETANKIIETIDQWEEKEGTIPSLFRLYRDMIKIQRKARAEMKPLELSLDDKTILQRISSGKPLIEFEDIPVNWNQFNDVFSQVSQLFKSYPELSEETSFKSMNEGEIEVLTRSWFNNKTPAVNQINLILHAALKPFLEACKDALVESINSEQWRRGYCPICGGLPDFAFLEKENGAKWLLCSRCDATWLFQRLECHCCGNKEQDTLAYFANDDDLYRVYICDRCKSYIKAIDLRKTEDEIILPLERYLTIDLDTQAQSKGYSICGRIVSDNNALPHPV